MAFMVALAVLTAQRLGVDWYGSMPAMVLIASGGVLALLRSRHAGTPLGKGIDICEGVALFAGITVTGVLLSYAAAKASVGYHDHWLGAADLWLGFDWVAMYEFMDRHREY